ncbi:gastrula zinc finger protein XlCGF57.1-like [Contarinia nasturtii]|uniref:gastrula zinc finger protein XlCGF57.1-like n=1 Tax=Contarinia nasturtii TaxID=265458 RepID=UPI0012D3AD75|nr:gastrula zinc finger protein XlCGF57.1-like [Contarinia nasturtii]
MDGRRERQPPDRHGLNKLPPETGELLLSEAEIKSEPMIKEEPESVGDIHMLPMSELDNNRPHNAIVGDQIDEINDFDGVCNLVEVKEEVKTENIEKKAEDISGGGHQSDVSMQSPDRGEQKATTSHGKATKGNGDSVCKSNRYNGKEGQAAAKPIGKQHKCTKCEYSTLKKSHFKTHILTHTGEKPFPCTLCSKRLTTKENLKRHMKTHVKEFLFSCSNCLHGFSQRNEQLEHEVAYKVKRYECFLCKKYSTLYIQTLFEGAYAVA